MGWFETYPIWESVTKEEYDKWKQEVSICGLFGETYKAESIYKEPGLLAMLDPNNIIGYKYYKKVGEETYYLCGSEEYEYLIEKGTVAE